jgi:hypothetical protein
MKLKIPGQKTTTPATGEGPSQSFSAPKQPAARKSFAEIVASATASGDRLPNLLEGEYKLQILATEVLQRSMNFKAELLILSSTNSERPPGMKVSTLRQMTDDGAGGWIQRFLFAACGAISLEEFVEAGGDMDDLAGKAQNPQINPLAGYFIGCRATPYLTKKNNKNIIREYYYALTESEEKELKEVIE